MSPDEAISRTRLALLYAYGLAFMEQNTRLLLGSSVLLQAQSKKLPPHRRSKLLVQLFSATLYGSTAVAMNFVNKAALAEFPLTNVLLLNQMLLALIVLPTLKVRFGG